MPLDQHDELVVRCPRIGDFVPFEYCRTSGKPFCWVIIECWAARVDIGQFLADHFSPAEIQAGLTRPESEERLGKLLDLANRFRP